MYVMEMPASTDYMFNALIDQSYVIEACSWVRS